jgi:RNA polymerase sporulation-specific sigma factor
VKDRDSLILDNQRLVYWTYQRMRWLPLVARMGEEDAVGAGTVGLIKAAEGFDPERGWKFTTYASRAIWREIDNASRSFGVATVPRTTRVKGAEAIDMATALRSVPFRTSRGDEDAQADEPTCPWADTAGEAAKNDVHARLRSVVRWLPEPGRSVIELVYFHGKTHREAASLLGIGRGFAYQAMRRSLVMMREELQEAV